MPKPGGLFAMMGPPEADEEDTLDDYSDDLSDTEPELEVDDVGAGPLDAYMETVFDDTAPMPDRVDAFRQAILTVLEERGGKV